MRFAELAWTGFVFANATRGDAPYQEMIGDEKLLQRLQGSPEPDDFSRLRGFLNKYGVPWTPKDLADQYLRAWPSVLPHVQAVASVDLIGFRLADGAVRAHARLAYEALKWPHVWGGPTVASKVLHFCNTDLFVMWDEPIQGRYILSHGIADYAGFLELMEEHAVEAAEDFRSLGLPGTPEEFLSRQLGYSPIRPLAKFLDDYNWVTITKGWPTSPPNWLMRLLC